MKGILGRKLGMTQIFDESGTVTPVTIIEAGPCFVTQVRRPERDGYSAIQLGFGEVKPKRLTRGQLGHLRRHNLPPLRYLREIRISEEEVSQYSEGQRITVDIFEPGEYVDVTGTSKGRGFQGGVKRHGFGGGPKTHGQSDRHRAPGSIGSGTTPGRVYKGTRMAGRMGNQRVTVQNLQVVRVYPEQNLIAVRGAVPGPRNGLVIIRSARKKQRQE
ncbi:MAG TPA: 50S ribosomal protein L3 [Caldilineae bacterium]|jgi:large subunit ribosomal protein L3|nr:50S ribosomal protein L3 [Caldilineae bacterium]